MLSATQILKKVERQIIEHDLGSNQIMIRIILSGFAKLLVILCSKNILTDDEIEIIINTSI